MDKERKKTWEQKVTEVTNCYSRAKMKDLMPHTFYDKLFFLDPKIKNYFKDTDWDHQKKALLHGLDHLMGFLHNPKDDHHRKQILRLARTHSKKGLNIHPHEYYYWIDALVLTFKDCDDGWYRDLEYYLRECLFFPISFMISLYHGGES